MAPKTNSQDPERQLMIKTKACQRLSKEAIYYEKEVKENEAKLEKMKEEKKDPYDIKKFEEVLGESRMMIPDSKNRLNKALHDLSEFLETNKDVGGEYLEPAMGLMEQQGLSGKDTSGEVEETNVENLTDGEAF